MKLLTWCRGFLLLFVLFLIESKLLFSQRLYPAWAAVQPASKTVPGNSGPLVFLPLHGSFYTESRLVKLTAWPWGRVQKALVIFSMLSWVSRSGISRMTGNEGTYSHRELRSRAMGSTNHDSHVISGPYQKEPSGFSEHLADSCL